MELMPWNTTHKYKCCFSCCSFFFLLRSYVTQYTTLLRMIICVMLIYDFGRKTLPATNKDPCTETHVVALKGKTEIQLTQGIFWSDACPHRHRGGSRLLWKWAHPQTASWWSVHWEPGRGGSWQLVIGMGKGKRLGFRRRGDMPPARLHQGYGTPQAIIYLCSCCNGDRNPEGITCSSHTQSFLVVVVVLLVEMMHSPLHHWAQKPSDKWPCKLRFLLLAVRIDLGKACIPEVCFQYQPCWHSSGKREQWEAEQPCTKQA